MTSGGDRPSLFEEIADEHRLQRVFVSFRKGCDRSAEEGRTLQTCFDHWRFMPGGCGMRSAFSHWQNNVD